jgi:ParB-like chromosome segregation protein Spo0J
MNEEERTDNMKTETVPIDSISQDPANARKHDERNLTAIRDSLRAFGQQKPIVVDQREIVIAGNGTLEAAKRLGWTEIAIVRTKLDNTQATAFGIADNRTAELAEWDDEILRSLLDSMDKETRDLLAFDQSELDAMLPPMVVEIVEDEIPEKVDPVTKPGDLWLLGAYFECEDCGKRFDYEEGNALGGECPCG